MKRPEVACLLRSLRDFYTPPAFSGAMEAAKAAFRALGQADRAAFVAFVAAEPVPICCPVADVTVVLSGETGKKAKFNGRKATLSCRAAVPGHMLR